MTAYARRPARTSQADVRQPEQHEFHRRPTRSHGHEQVIRGFTRGDRGPALVVALECNGEQLSKFFIFPEYADTVARALEHARTPDWTGRRDTGSWTSGRFTYLSWASVGRSAPPAVYLGRTDERGDFVGKAIPIFELDALAEALRWLANRDELEGRAKAREKVAHRERRTNTEK